MLLATVEQSASHDAETVASAGAEDENKGSSTRGALIVAHLKLIVALTLLQLSTVTYTRAEIKIDVAKLTCKEFMVPIFVLPDDIAYWLSGYYNGRHGNTVIDIVALRDYVTKVEQYCANHQDETVMKAAENVVRASP